MRYQAPLGYSASSVLIRVNDQVRRLPTNTTGIAYGTDAKSPEPVLVVLVGMHRFISATAAEFEHYTPTA